MTGGPPPGADLGARLKSRLESGFELKLEADQRRRIWAFGTPGRGCFGSVLPKRAMAWLRGVCVFGALLGFVVGAGAGQPGERPGGAGSGWAALSPAAAFDDRDWVAAMEEGARVLWESGRLKELKCPDQGCAIEAPKPGGQAMDFAARVFQAESATVVFGAFQRAEKKKVAFGTAGGGFFISSSGLCVTCRHVVSEKGTKGMVVMARDGRVFPVKRVLASDPVEDVAVVEVELPVGEEVPVLGLADRRLPVGAPVFVMSHPDERFYMLTTGVVSRHTLWREKGGVAHFMSVTADFAKGSSGCPVMDETGAVVGIVNNTESIYYDNDGRKKQLDLQMVIKNVTPVSAVRGLLKGAGADRAAE